MTNKTMVKEFLLKNTQVCGNVLEATALFMKEEHGIELSTNMIKRITSNLRTVQQVLSENPELDIRNDTKQAQQAVVAELRRN